jgi:hypothetical protein
MCDKLETLRLHKLNDRLIYQISLALKTVQFSIGAATLAIF